MCGICGVWNYAQNEPVERALLQRMTGSLAHRGPDDEGFYCDDAAGVGLGFRRLAIIDLSPSARQPMTNEDERLWIIFNGEIYNFLDLRPGLEQRGHVFHSHSDTEVILHLFEEQGPACVCALNGMFGMAIWDKAAQRLLLARDRLGKKPLYYYDDGEHLFFASELKALLQNPAVPRKLDFHAFSEYLALGYTCAPRTALADIKQLPAAHFLSHPGSQAKAPVSPVRYWDWLPAFQQTQNLSEAEWSERLRSSLKEAVRQRMISDVPLGAFLSGGVDSSSVVALMAESSDRPVKTFSIGFEQDSFNELPYARQVAKQYGTDHHEFIVEADRLQDLLPDLVYQLDEPFADSSAIPTYYVNKIARQHVTVCLSGDGGDEALGGYRRYAKMLRETRVDRLPMAWRRAILSPLAAALPVGVRGQRTAERWLLDFAARYQLEVRHITPRLTNELLTPQALKKVNPHPSSRLAALLAASRELDPLSRLQYTDAMSYLPEDILVKVDRTSMANSLEARCPFLDFHLLELCAAIPPALRFKNGQGKYLLKTAMSASLPHDLLFRDKMGFAVPLRSWFRKDLGGFARELLLSPQTTKRGLWNPASVQKIIERCQGGVFSLETPLYMLIFFELWLRAYQVQVEV